MSTLPTDTGWKKYGKKHPYFGVTGDKKFLNENLNKQNIDEFFNSGYTYVEKLFDVIHTKIDPEFKAIRILDFGCGPGRLIIPFSKLCQEVVGMDISEEMLQEAQKNCLIHHVNNASLLLSDDKLKNIKGQKFDLVNSFIVLQHVNIKRGENLIKLLVESIKSNGVGVLHITYYDNYPNRRPINYFRFRIPYLYSALRFIRSLILGKDYKNLPLMQMNNYNLNRIFSLLQKYGVKEVHVSFTDHHDYWGLMLYFQKK